MKRLILLSFLFISYSVKGILYVDVKKNSSSLYVNVKQSSIRNISLMVSSGLCHTELEDKLSKSITHIIEENLSNCGVLNLTHDKTSDILAMLNLSETLAGEFKLSFKLLDSFTKKKLITKSIIFSKTEWREIGHSISDIIHDRLIGETGYFHTKITYIAEERDDNSRSVRKVAVMNRDGSNVRYLTNGDNFVSTPRFAPDGKSIVYISYLDGISDIRLRNLADDNESLISSFEGVISAPRFSPDGKSLFVSHSLGGKTNILSINLNDKHIEKITRNSAISTSPSLSPDQRYVVFSSDISGRQQLYIIDLTKREKKPKRISFGNGGYSTPVWSPKGDLIAFTKSLSGKFYIGIMKPDGENERILSEGYKIESPAWLPNGKEIVFTRTESINNSKLYLVDLSNKKHTIVSTPTNAYLPDCLALQEFAKLI